MQVRLVYAVFLTKYIMKMKLVIVFALVTLSGCATQNAHWGYSGQQGAKNWATLSSDNFACSGKNQSPINLTGFIESDLPPIQFNYQRGGYEILNNGHTAQVNYEKGSRIEVDGQVFELLQFHFHAPSENHINNKSYPLPGSRYFCESLFWASQPKQAAKT